MLSSDLVEPHDVVMTGENSFMRLSTDGGKTVCDRLSHWRVLWSPAGQGHALFIESTLTGTGPRIYTDNAGVARFLQGTIETLLYKGFGAESLPLIDAKFERDGNSLSTVSERITSADDSIVMSYWNLGTPFVLNIAPGKKWPIGVYSTLIPANGVQLSLNGKAAAAQPFTHTRYSDPVSDCCLAWSETWMRQRA
jgi:hypothetical protein